MQAQVTVTYVNHPAPGKKMGNIKTNELGTVFVWPNKLADFHGPGNYLIEYSETPPSQPGQNPFRKYESMLANPQQPAVQQPPPPQPYQQPRPAPLTYERDEPAHTQSCSIFVTGVIGRCLQGTGTFPDAHTLRSMIYNAKVAWETEMEGKQAPQDPAQYDERNPPIGDWPQ